MCFRYALYLQVSQCTIGLWLRTRSASHHVQKELDAATWTSQESGCEADKPGPIFPQPQDVLTAFDAND